jgi:2-polyprenyl-3-methyl-5-hydroxy-6-metoxy-1,4-benzoquinol methylase
MNSDTKQNILERIAEEYDTLSDFDRHGIEHEARMLVDYYRGGSVLEIGCASGVMTRILAPAVERLVVVDGSQRYLSRLRQELPGVEFVHAMVEDYEPREQFRHILAARILEHLEDPISFLKRVGGWLTPDGELHLTVPNARSFHRLLGVELGLMADVYELSERDKFAAHYRVYDSALLEAHIAAAGLTITSKESVFFKPLSNAQLESWEPRLIEALFRVVRHFPEHGSVLYFRCRRNPQ